MRLFRFKSLPQKIGIASNIRGTSDCIINIDNKVRVITKKVMLVFGTRPETIRICPLVKEKHIIFDVKRMLDCGIVDGRL